MKKEHLSKEHFSIERAKHWRRLSLFFTMKPTNHQRYFDKDSPKQEKIRLIFLPFLLLSSGIIALCCGVYWYLVYETGLDSYGVGFVAVFVSAFAPFLLARRIDLIERKSEFLDRLFYLICILSILIPALCFQAYIKKSAGKLTPLHDITEIAGKPQTRFYTVEQPTYTTKLILDFTYIKPAGRRTNKKRLETYCITPVYSHSQSNRAAWIGKMYKSESFNPDDEQIMLNSFASASVEKFGKEARKPFTYLERIVLTEKSGYYRALNVSEVKPHDITVLIPHNTPFEERAGNSLHYALLAYITGLSLIILIILVSPFNERKLHGFLSGGRYNQSPTQSPSKVIKGKRIANDKLILIRKTTKRQLEKDLKEACDLYNSEGGKIYPDIQPLNNKEFAVTFPYDIDFEAFCYLIHFLCHKTNSKDRPEITGWTKALAGDPWITEAITGKQLMIYIPEEDKEYENVYVTTENGDCYKFGFNEETISEREIYRPYQKPFIL